MIEAEAQEGISLSVLGFAEEAQNELMLQAIAQRGLGRYVFAESESVIRGFLRDQFSEAVRD